MPGHWQNLMEGAGWAVALPMSLIAVQKTLGILAYWSLEAYRMVTVRSLLAREENLSLRASLVKMLGPIQPPQVPKTSPTNWPRRHKGHED